MADLPTNFKDDILDTSVNTRRRYRVYENTDGTIELEDVTEYSQVGDEFGAGQINAINTEVNKKFDKNMIVRDLDTINAITKEGYVPDALALKEVNSSLEWELIDTISHTSTTHTETLSKNLSDYKEVKIVCSCSMFLASNVFDSSFISDTAMTFLVGGAYLGSSYGAGVRIKIANNAIIFDNNSINSDGKGLSGIFYIYVR